MAYPASLDCIHAGVRLFYDSVLPLVIILHHCKRYLCTVKFPTYHIRRDQWKHWNLPAGTAQVQNTCSGRNEHPFRLEASILLFAATSVSPLLERSYSSCFGLLLTHVLETLLATYRKRAFPDHTFLINAHRTVCTHPSSISSLIPITIWGFISANSH